MNAPAKVDVLAVIARDAVQAVQWRTSVGQNEFALATESDDARAAVAELIEAAKWADEMIAQHARNEDGQALDTTPLSAALARIGGAS